MLTKIFQSASKCVYSVIIEAVYRVRPVNPDNFEMPVSTPVMVVPDSARYTLETYRSQEEFDVFHVSIGHSELWLEQFE